MSLFGRARHGRVTTALYAIVVSALFQAGADAASLYWDTTPLAAGLGTASGTWGTDVYWNTSSSGATPGSFSLTSASADDVFFNSTGGGSIGVNGNVLASSMTFGTSQPITLSAGGGNSITIGGTGASSGVFVTATTAAPVISTDINLNSANTTFTVLNSGATSASLTLGKITGASGVVQALTVGSSATGGVTINNVIANGGGGGAVALTIDGGDQAVRLTAINTYTGVTTLRRGTLNLDFSAQDDNTANLIRSSNTIEFSGLGGRLLLTGKSTGTANSQAFATKTYTSGAVAIAAVSSGAAVNFDVGTVTRNNNLTLDLTKPTSGNIAIGNGNDATGIIGPWVTYGGYTDYAIASGGNVAGLNNVTDTTQASWVSSSANYTRTGSGAQTLTASRFANTLRYTHGSTVGSIATAGFDFTANGILNGGGATYTVSGTGALVIGGSNELVLLGKSAITISASVKSTAANQKIILGNNSAVSTALVSLTGGLNTAGDVTVVANGNNANVLSGVLSGTASKITLTGPGTLTLNAMTGGTGHSVEVNSTNGGVFTTGAVTSTYTGGFTLTSGTVKINANPANNNLGTGKITFAGGTFAINSNDTSSNYANDLDITGPVTIGTVGLNATVTFSGVNQAISNNPTITVGSSGSTRGVKFTTNPMQLLSDASFIGSGNTPLLQLLGGFDLKNGDRTLTFNGTTTTTVGGALSDSTGSNHTLTLAGTGTVTINTMSAFNNGTGLVIDGVTAKAAATLPTTAFVTINSGSFDIMNTATTLAGLRGSGGSVISTGGNKVITIGDTRNHSYAGSITAGIGITKSGSGTQVLSGVNTYSGATTVSDGKLLLGQGGAMGATAVAVSGTATYGTTYTTSGNTIAGGSTLNLGSGTTLDLNDANANTLRFTSTGTFGGATLKMDLGTGGASDTLQLVGAATVTGDQTINLTATGSSLATGDTVDYTLITASSGLTGATFTLASDTLVVGGKRYTLALARTTTAVTLNVTLATEPATAFWSGAVDGSWSTIGAGPGFASNWKDAIGGADTQQSPGPGSDVTFIATGAGNLSTTLGADFTIKSLTFNSTASGAVTIGGANTLTLTPASSSVGVTVAASSGNHVLSTKVALGADQTWTVTDAGQILTASAEISGSSKALTKAGVGTLVLSGASVFTGTTTLSGGALRLTGSLAAGNAVTVGNGGTLDSVATIGGSLTVNNGGTLTLGASSVGTLAVGGAVTLHDGAILNVQFGAPGEMGVSDGTCDRVTVGGGQNLAFDSGAGTITLNMFDTGTLDIGDYKLFTYTGATPANFSASKVNIVPPVGATFAYELDVTTSGEMWLKVAAATGGASTTTIARESGDATTTYGEDTYNNLTFRVTVNHADATGNVTIMDGGLTGTLIGSGALGAGGTAVIGLNSPSVLTAGAHNNIVAVYEGDVNYLGSVSAPLSTQQVNQKPVTITGVTAGGKVYNANDVAVLSGGTVSGKVGSDVVTPSGGSGAFASKNVGTHTVTASGFTLGGAAAANYSLSAQPTVGTATITAKQLTLSGLSATARGYDGTTIVALTGTPTLTGEEAPGTGTSDDGKWYTGDAIALSGTAAGSVADRHAGVNKTVTIGSLTLDNNAAGNYSGPVHPVLTVTITPKALTMDTTTLVANNKAWDGGTAATFTGGALLAEEAGATGTEADGKPYTGDTVSIATVSGAFADATVANGKLVTVTGVTLGGAQAANYTATTPVPDPALTANITVPGAVTWKSNAGSTAWATDANWINAAPPDDLTTALAVFNAGSYANQPQVTGTRRVFGVSVGASSGGLVTISGTGTPKLQLGAGGITVDAASAGLTLSSSLPVTLSAAQTWSNGSATTLTVSGLVDGTGDLGKSGSGKLNLNNSGNTFTGAIVLNAGTLTYGGTAGTLPYLGNGGTLYLNGGTVLVPKNNNANIFNNPVVMDGSDSVTIEAGGTGSDFNRFESTTLTLSDAPTITFSIPAGASGSGLHFNFDTLQLGAGAAPTFGGTTSVSTSRGACSTIAGGVILLSTTAGVNAATITNNVVNGGTGSGEGQSSLSLAGPFVGGAAGQTLTLAGSGGYLLAGLTADASAPGLVIDGPTVYGTVANTFAGNVTLQSGAIWIGTADALPTGCVLTIHGGTIDLYRNQELAGLNGAGGTVACTDGSNHTLLLSGSGTYSCSTALSPTITARIILTKDGTGTQTLSGTSTYTGTTTVRGGYLVAGSNSPSGSPGAFGGASSSLVLGVAGGNQDAGILIGGAFTVGRGIAIPTSDGEDTGTRVLALGGNTAHASEFSGNVTLGSANSACRGVTLTATDSGTVTFSGVIANPTTPDTTTYTVTKSGAGTVILTRANTYTGSTSVDTGTLTVNNTSGSGTGTGAVSVNNSALLNGTGTISGAVTANDSATLGFSGTLSGAVTVNETATLAPGHTAIGTPTLAGNLTFAATSKARFNLSDTYSGSNDKVTLTGTSATLTGAGATIEIDCGATLDESTAYVLFDLTGGSASVASDFSATPVWVGTEPAHAASFTITTVGKQVRLVYAPGGAAPEIVVTGNSVDIPGNGSNVPAPADHTDFGDVAVVGGTLVRTFTIANIGNIDLNLTGTPKVVIGGAQAAEFTVTQLPTSPVAASGTTTFQVTFDPLRVGERVATLTIASDDADEGSFIFNLKGTGTADSFVSAAAGAYDDNATWAGGAANPAGGASELVSIGHAVYVANAAHSTNDQIALTAGGSLEARGVSPSAASLDLSAGDGSLLSGNASSDVGATRTITLDAATGMRLTLGAGRVTTIGVGANVNNNTAYGVTVNTGNGTATTLNGTHTFNVDDNGTGLGTLTLSQAIAGTAAVQDAIVKTGTGRLTFNAGPSLNVGDGDRINIEAGSVAMVSAPANLTVSFVNGGVVLRSDSITWPASTTLAFQSDGFLTANRGDYSPTYNSKFTGSGSITVSAGRTHTLSPDASSTWNGVLIVGNGGSGIARIGSAALTPVSVTMRGATTYDVVVLSSEAVDVATGFLIVNTPTWSVGGIDNHAEGDPKNTRLGSRGSGLTRTLTVNVADGQTYEYQGALANGIRGDTSVLALVKAGNGTQVLSGQTGPSCYSGGTAVNAGTLVVENGSEAVTKTTTGGDVSNDSTANFTIADTTGLFVGQPVSGYSDGRVLISAISGTTVTIANRSGALVTIPNEVAFAATSPTGVGDVTVADGATLAGTGRIAGNVLVQTGGHLAFDKTTGAADTPLRIGSTLTLNNNTVTVEVLGSPLGNGTYVIASANVIAGGSTVNATPAITGAGLGAGAPVASVAINGNNLELTVSGVVDTTDPEWVAGWPAVDTIGSRNFSVRYKVNEAGTGYFVVLPAGSTPAPDATQVSEGKDGSDNAVALSGNSALLANTEVAVVVSGLTKTTAYDVYFVARDLANNLQDAPVSVLAVTTLDDVFSWDGDTSSAWANGTNWNGTGVVAPANNITDDTAHFNLAVYPNQPTVSGARSIKGITVGSGSTASLAISGASTPTLTIGAGGIAIANSANPVMFASTLPIALGGAQTWANRDDSVLDVDGTIATAGHLLTVDLSNGTDTAIRGRFSGDITGAGGIRKTGTARLVLDRVNYGFTGGLEVDGGTVYCSTWGTLSSAVTVTSGKFIINENLTIQGLIGQAGTTVDSASTTVRTLAISVASGVCDYAGVISNGKTFNIGKSGDGKQVLSGNNIYLGTTAVNGGTLLVNGTHTGGGAYTVAAGATLGGSGSIPNAITVNGTLSPGGNAAGDTGATLTVAGDVTFVATAHARFDLGASSDKVRMTGASAVLTGAGAKIRIAASAMDGRSQYVLFDLTGASASIASDFDPIPEWIGTRPAGAGGYRVATQGRRVLLQQHGVMMILR